MAATTERGSGDGQNKAPDQPPDRLKNLYPSVNEDENLLPRQWSPKDKYNFIGLSQNNLRVHYKGVGKTHKDAASVRATQPIPSSCGIYYFEVKIISKGRDGYMGIGLSVQGVNLNRLPGWDTHSYGYHGDDGHSFCSSGTGQPYGPTFTTGDVIGCCINLIDNTCFYTKNGVNLGVAFRDLPPHLYPTVGLQTPGEIIEANFGESPFIFDIEDYMRELRMKTNSTIERFPVADSIGEWQAGLHKIVSTYLVHYGYCATAESFARNTQQSFEEELTSIKNRQKIQRLVLAGRMGEAIDTTYELYPGILETKPNLLFMLKCRQFIEMVNGTDSQVRAVSMRSPKSQGSNSARSSPNMSPLHHTLLSPKSNPSVNTSGRNSPHSSPHPHVDTSHAHIIPPSKHSPPSSSSNSLSTTSSSSALSDQPTEEQMNSVNTALNGDSTNSSNTPKIGDERMDISEQSEKTLSHENGVSNGCINGASQPNKCTQDHDMEIDQPPPKRQFCGGSQLAIEKMIQFGRELRVMCEQLKREYGANEANERTLKEAASMLAYSDPWSSPVGYQLEPVQREPVCAALNSAILESHGLPKQPSLELAIGQVHECMRLMSRSAVGSCAFANVNDYIH